MPKFTIEFEANTIEELKHQLWSLTDLPTTVASSFPDDAEALTARPVEVEPDPEAPLANGEAGKRGRGRPKKATVTPVEAKAEPETPAETPKSVSQAAQQLAATVAATDPNAQLPPLDLLKAAITTAVRHAQKGEGDPAILGLLPAFKTETGLDFIMNAKDEHRVALFHLTQRAGLTVG